MSLNRNIANKSLISQFWLKYTPPSEAQL